jgi:conjugative relaxase-like TrwC/TraI family protein
MREVPAARLGRALRAVLSIGRMRARSWEYYAREVAGGLEDYYAGAGEAPGVWTGRGAAGAGIAGPVSGEALGLAFGEAAHPVSGEALGLGWRTPDGVTGFDATFSAPKSVSVLFALAGGEVRAAVRGAHVAAVEEAGLAYLEDHAALTRRGHNGVMVCDTEGLVIARFEHRTSRAGDPQLHSHCLILNKVRDPADGSWRALDGRALYLEAKPAGVIYQAALRAELTRRLGVAWGPVSKHGQAELAGMPAVVLEQFSKRAAQVEAAAEAKVAELERALGRGLEADERGRIYRLAVLDTRAAKDHTLLEDRTLYGHWAAELQECGHEPAAIVHEALTTRRVPRVLARGVDALAGMVLAEVTAERATFARRDVAQAVARHLDVGGGGEAARVRSKVEALTEQLLARREVVCLQTPERLDPPPEALVRRDGWSVWDAPQQVRYTTAEILTIEARILHTAAIGSVARAGVVERPVLQDALTVESRRLGAEQLTALGRLTRQGRRVEVLIGPAGSGKTTMLRVAARAWEAAGHPVIGLSHTAAAAEVLRSEADVTAETLAKFLDWHAHNSTPPAWQLGPHHIVIVDEAGMVNTRQLDRLVQLAQRHGAKLVLVGDDRQLGAVRAPGGMFAALAETLGATELSQSHRFTNRWEATSLAQLRRRDGAWLEAFEAHGRLHGGDETKARSGCFRGWWAAQQAGRDAIMLAADQHSVIELANQARATRVATGQVSASGLQVRTEHAAQTIGIGDLIETRRNHRGLRYGNGPQDWVRNHDRWHVVDVDARHGTLTVEHARHLGRITLPGDYVAAHVRLGYASTIASAQGLTVDEAHVQVRSSMYANELYTGLSRGRDANHVHVVCEPDHAAHAHGQPGAPSPVEVVARVALRERPDWAAHSVVRRTMNHPERPNVVIDRMAEVVRTLARTPPGVDRQALEDYRQHLAASFHAPEPTRPLERTAIRPRVPVREPPGLGIER